MSLDVEHGVSELAIRAPTAFHFSLVSPAILELITEYLTGFDILALHLTSSRALCLHMNAGGVKKFIIARNSVLPATWQFSNWTCLASFSQLHSINIQIPTLYVWTRGYRIFNYFPKCLRSLELLLPVHFGDLLLISETDLAASSTSKSCTKINSQKYSIKSNSITKDLQPERLKTRDFDVKEQFPFLERFLVSCAADTNNAFAQWPERSRENVIQRFIESCPVTLRHLAIPKFIPHLGHLDLPSLTHLEILSISKAMDPDYWSSRSPPSLTRLDVHIRPQNLSAFAIPTLEHLHLTLDSGTDILQSDAWVELHLFQSLTELDIETLAVRSGNAELFSNLPKQLKSLKLSGSRCPHLIFTELPPLLTHLDLHLEKLQISTPLRFPPALRTLVLWKRFQLTPEDFSHLPPTLESLSIDFTVNCWAAKRKTPNETPCLTDECAASLPQSITYLNLTNTCFGPLFFQILPSKLTRLSFITNASFAAADLGQLPATLIELNLLFTGPLNPRCLDNLPSGLTRMDIWRGQDVDLEAISHLPKSLLHLTIQNSITMGDSWVSHLPNALRTLILPRNDLTSKSASLLPPSLTVLQVSRIVLCYPKPSKSELLASFPPYIKVYDLPWYSAKGRKVNLASLY